MRPKEFDPEEALEGALSQFWSKGYGATNLPDLLDAMKLGRASFYNAYGSKRAAFLRSLDLYFVLVEQRLSKVVSEAADAREAIGAVIDTILALAQDQGRWRGCLIGNSALELAPHDREVADRLAIGIRALRTVFQKALERGRTRPNHRDTGESEGVALLLVAGAQGLLVLAKSGISADELAVARNALVASIDTS